MAKSGDRIILETLANALDGVAVAIGSNCEVVLHDLEDLSKSIIHINNGHVTGRHVGSPITNFGIEVLEKAKLEQTDVVGPYFIKLDDGRTLRCVTNLIRNPAGKAIGMLCVNIDISVPMLDFFTNLLDIPNGNSDSPTEHFSSTPKDLVSRALSAARETLSKKNKISPAESGKIIVEYLYRQGIFNVRGAADMVAEECGISRGTVYNYLREVKMLER